MTSMLPSDASRGRAWPLLLLVYIAVVLWLCVRLQEAPRARSERVAAPEFSVQRAHAHVVAIASRPHPAGSPANARVRDYLIETLQGLGAEVELQRKLQIYGHTQRTRAARFAHVENIVARWPGREAGSALLLMSHYDSVPGGPGAGDNASGVATVLETVRALHTSGRPLRNELIVLLSDAEEVGMIGAQAFFNHHRWAGQVGMVLNFDPRGSRGPVAMYETSHHNGGLIDALAQVAPAPFATSLINAIMHRMPNPTDLSIAFAAGKPGMNFAFIDGFFDYHGPTDTPERLSLDSLEHMGSYALATTRYFGEVDMPLAITPDRHYFNPVGHVFVVYPPWVDWLVWLMAAALLALASWRAQRDSVLTVPGLLCGIVGASLVLLLPALIALLLHQLLDEQISRLAFIAGRHGWFAGWTLLAFGAASWLVGVIRVGCGWRRALIVGSLLVGLGVVAGAAWPLLAVAVASCLLLTVLLRRGLPSEAWIAGSQWLLLMIALALLVMLAGAAHVLLYPLLAVALYQAWRWRRTGGRATPIAWLLVGLPGIALLGGIGHIFDLLLGFAMPVVVVLPMLLILLIFAPLLDNESARATGLGVGLLGLAGLSWLVLSTPWSDAHPQPTALFVLHDADQNQSYWASSDRDLTVWHRSVLGDDPGRGAAPYLPSGDESIWLTPLEGVAVAPSRFELIAADRTRRLVRLRVFPSRVGDTVTVWLAPNTDLRSWQVDGQELQSAPGDRSLWWTLSAFAMPAEGFELTLEFGPSEPWPELLVNGVRNALPDGLEVPARPAMLMRAPRTYSDSTVTVHRVAIEALVEPTAGRANPRP